jgi:hypothetical protein
MAKKTTTRTGGRKGRWPEPTAELELAWEAELELAWERFKAAAGLSGSMDASDEAERCAAVSLPELHLEESERWR